MPKADPQFVVRTRHPGWRWAAWLAVLLLVLVAAWLGFEWGYERGGEDRAHRQQRLQDLRARVEHLREENGRLRDKTSRLERAGDVDRHAYDEIKQDLNRLQKKLIRLREELAFYRNIMARPSGEEGLRIQQFQLAASNAGGGYRFSLVLTRLARGQDTTKGRIELTVGGRRGGAEEQWDVSELMGSTTAPLEFAFKYFQTVEGRFELPEGFVPEQVALQVIPEDKDAEAVERTYSWAELTG